MQITSRNQTCQAPTWWYRITNHSCHYHGFFSPIQIFVSPKLVAIDENINISRFITPAQANVEVTILYRREGETDWRTLSTVGTNEQGNYLYVWQPQEDGKYKIKATAVIYARA